MGPDLGSNVGTTTQQSEQGVVEESFKTRFLEGYKPIALDGVTPGWARKRQNQMRKIMMTSLVCSLVVLVHPFMAQAQQQAEKTIQTRVRTEVIPYEVKYIFNRDMSPGRVKKVTDGEDGQKVVTYTDTYEGETLIDTKKDVKIEPATDAVFHMGKSGIQLTDRGSFTRAKVITMESSAYLPSQGSGTGRTASGMKAKVGVVAVDPKVIKLGTLLYVEGYGLAVAADTGGAIKGNKIDVCLPTMAKARKWGRRKVKVHIFRDRHTAEMAARYRSSGK